LQIADWGLGHIFISVYRFSLLPQAINSRLRMYHPAGLLRLGGLEGQARQRAIFLLLLFASEAGKKQQQKE
jgi:hypothetical protein